jgi:anaerobic magnesium-protoporphyrin IX monomethyl ester cyclase
MSTEVDYLKENLGTRRIAKFEDGELPDCGRDRPPGVVGNAPFWEAVDILLVNPPTPDGGYWIRTQHRVGRRTRENMVWPQVSLAQMAALLDPPYRVGIIDANAEKMGWQSFPSCSINTSPSIT